MPKGAKAIRIRVQESDVQSRGVEENCGERTT